MAGGLWIQESIKKRGSLHRKLGIPERQKIPVTRLRSIKSRLSAKAKGGKLTSRELQLFRKANLALTLGRLPKRGRRKK